MLDSSPESRSIFRSSRRRRRVIDVVDESEDFKEFNDVTEIDLFAPIKIMKQSPFVLQHQAAQSQRKKTSIIENRAGYFGTSKNVLCLGLTTFFFFFISICCFIFWLEPLLLNRVMTGPVFNYTLTNVTIPMS